MRDELTNYPEIELRLHPTGHAFQAHFAKKETLGTEQ